ncbi:disks large-associated protein 5-like [Nilaparvata lugens]|uniref:disks large-associated protein 5-like n=1 Tax=Nilaparvata lugens TaxID=108931 RepID=UPI00193DF79E|nr:disks large-associated protein 5-like [Nilaparvata lugens]
MTDVSDTFQVRLEEESFNLSVLCNRWQSVLDSTGSIPKEMEDEIRGAVGQTKLLVNEKLKQFKDLLKKFQKGDTDESITPNDLEGFWELVLIQVNDVKGKFSKLEHWKKGK